MNRHGDMMNHIGKRSLNTRTMKALIIYDDFASAVRASTALRQAAHRAKLRANWNLRPWRSDILGFAPTADEALKDAVDADVIMLAGRRVYALPPWLRQWLESWGSRRKSEDCALVVVRDETEGKGSAPNPGLSLFAERHRLDFIVENDASTDDEILSCVLTLSEDDSPVRRTPQAAAQSSILLMGGSFRNWGINE